MENKENIMLFGKKHVLMDLLPDYWGSSGGYRSKSVQLPPVVKELTLLEQLKEAKENEKLKNTDKQIFKSQFRL